MSADHLQELRDQGKVRPRLTPTEVAWSGRYIIAATIAWLIAELAGVAGLDWRWLVWLVVAFVAAAPPTACCTSGCCACREDSPRVVRHG